MIAGELSILPADDLAAMIKREKGLLDENRRLRILANGCNDHPAYRAKRKPTADCACCRTMWQAASE